MNKLHRTQALIDQALQSERMHSGLESKSDWSQFAESGRVEVEVFTNCIVDLELRKVTGYKIVTTRFYEGSKRISRAYAEELLAAAAPVWTSVDESEYIDSVTGDYK